MEMITFKDSLERLDYLEKQRDWSASVKDQIQRLKIEIKFLRTALRCAVVKDIQNQNLANRFNEIDDVFTDVGEIILSMYLAANGNKVLMDLDGWLLYMLETIELVKPEVDRCYHSISGLSHSFNVGGDLMFRFIDDVLENLEDLLWSQLKAIVRVKKLIDPLQRRLRFLKSSLQFATKLRIYYHWPDLLEEIRYVATAAASFSFSCWIYKMDENKEPERDRGLYLALNYNKSNREETRLFLGILKASKSLTSDAADALLVGFIDFALQHLAELLSPDSNLEIPTKDQFECLHEELKLLKTLLLNTPMQFADYEKSYPRHMGTQVDKVARLIEGLYVGSMDDDKLFCLLERLKLINSLYLMERINHEADSVAHLKDQFKTLREDMQLLRTFLTDTQKGYYGDKKFKVIHSHFEALALQVGSAIHPLYANEIKEDMAEEMSCLLPDLLEMIKLIKADMRKILPRATSSNFPKTHGQKGMTIYLKQLNKLLNRRDAIISHFVKPHIEKAAKFWIEDVQNELQLLISFVENSEEEGIEIGESLEIRIMNVANEAKYATDPIFLRDHPFWYCMLKFSDLIEEVKLIKKEIEIINEKTAQHDTLTMGEVIVGFEDEAQHVIEQLIGGLEQLNVISIIGMGGLGKTTLAKKLYSYPVVVEYFDVRAWCCISQVFQERQVLLDILDQVLELTEGTNQRTNADLKDMLRKCLKGRRYLIVIDDIWDIKAWTALRRCFDDDCNGSRILFTTRLQERSLNVQARSIPYLLRLFTDKESLELLQKKLFPGGRCPKKQVKNLKQIAKGCKGLPLAIVLVAGVLARKNKEEWKQVAKSLGRHIGGDMQNLSMGVLELSYKNLPDHLRPCFLYLGAFPEDKEILAKKLMWLWAAEGFIQKTEQKSSEDIAKDYLMDLIGRSLVIVAERGSSGGVKTFRVHDLLRSFSLAKAREEKFLLLLDGNDEPFAPTDLKFHQQEDGYVESYNSNPITHKQCRLCIYSMLNDFEKWPSSLPVCSLLHFAPAVHLDMISYDASSIFGSFKFLNVLDLGRLVLEDLNCEITLLDQLRLLTVRIHSTSIPSSISNLRNLETFLVKGLRGEVAIPNTIWSMVCLRHLHIDNRASMVFSKRDVKGAILDKLETLSTPILPYGANSTDVSPSLPKLRKLKCIVTEFQCDFDSLNQLESLKVFYYGRKVSHRRFSFPSNLNKLTLSKFHLPWSDIATIATLPNLEVLKLLFKAFDGKEWETRDDEFPKLKYLKLEALDIEEWNVSSQDHFPVLEKLVVHRCKHLDEIPSSFGDVNTLQMIEVKWCNSSAANSARNIYLEQQEFGNEGLEVIIHPYPSDQGLASSS